jgi:hypothetical protein
MMLLKPGVRSEVVYGCSLLQAFSQRHSLKPCFRETNILTRNKETAFRDILLRRFTLQPCVTTTCCLVHRYLRFAETSYLLLQGRKALEKNTSVPRKTGYNIAKEGSLIFHCF